MFDWVIATVAQNALVLGVFLVYVHIFSRYLLGKTLRNVACLLFVINLAGAFFASPSWAIAIVGFNILALGILWVFCCPENHHRSYLPEKALEVIAGLLFVPNVATFLFKIG